MYIAGPMSGLPEFNHPAFFAAEELLREYNSEELMTIINPARNVVDTAGLTKDEIWEAYMKISREQVRSANLLYLLDGWENSKGAVEEVKLAMDLNLRICRVST